MEAGSLSQGKWAAIFLLNKTRQQTGKFLCPHCPFRTNKKEYLEKHEKHHFAGLEHQCAYCSYSSKRSRSLQVNHGFRVHSEKFEKSQGQMTEDFVQLEYAENKATNTDLNSDTDEETEETEAVSEELTCLCGQSLSACGDISFVECDWCKNRFHMECFGFTPEEKARMIQEEESWYCHHCAYKIAKKSLFPSDDDLLALPNLEAIALAMTETRSPTGQPSSCITPKSDDSTICRSEILALAHEITLFQKEIFSTTTAFKEERDAMLMARSSATNDLRMNILALEKEDRKLANKVAILMKFGEQLQHQRKELLAAKMLLDQDIGKMTATASYSNDELRKKRLELSDLADKLATIEDEYSQLAMRIQGVKEQKEQAYLKLSKVRVDLDKMERDSAAEEPSVIALQLKALVHDQHGRIKRFIGLEKNLAECFKRELDEIQQMKEGWLDALNGCGEV